MGNLFFAAMLRKINFKHGTRDGKNIRTLLQETKCNGKRSRDFS